MSVVSRQGVPEPWIQPTFIPPLDGGGGVPSAAVAHPSGEEKQIVARSSRMVRLLEEVRAAAESSAPVLVTGGNGCGKELVARTLHAQGRRARGEFVSIDCGLFPEPLLEAELFGCASGGRPGRLQSADGGTLFLDEVAEMSPMVQAKVLRVIEDGLFEPIGGSQPVSVDVRLVCATRQDLKARVDAGQFREDLYFRIRGVVLHVPTLREREGDLEPLVAHFLKIFWEWPVPPSIHPRAMAALRSYALEGNVRELKYAMQRAVVLARGGQVDVQHLPPEILSLTDDAAERAMPRLADALHERERSVILDALRLCRGRRSRTARVLGISRKTLWHKLRVHGIDEAEFTD